MKHQNIEQVFILVNVDVYDLGVIEYVNTPVKNNRVRHLELDL